MIRVEATTQDYSHTPPEVTRAGAGDIRPARPLDTAPARHASVREFEITGSQLVVGCICFLCAIRLVLWAVLKLWLSES